MNRLRGAGARKRILGKGKKAYTGNLEKIIKKVLFRAHRSWEEAGARNVDLESRRVGFVNICLFVCFFLDGEKSH